jgi:Ankyrin repeats (3 copies)
MFPNPQDALPLPPQPNLEQYKKLAKELVKACKSADTDAVGAWAAQWVKTLARLQNLAITRELPVSSDRWIAQVEEFARRKLQNPGQHARCSLADAQFVIARAHGYGNWPAFAAQITAQARHSSPESQFESAVDAIVGGDARAVERLLLENPRLIRARSAREHRATLLHYVAANGIEGYRQKTPKNAVTIAEILLNAGAEVDAVADVYGGGATTLGLAATSVHPERAGVQTALLETLLRHGAQITHPALAGSRQAIVAACLANGRARAAEFFAARAAQLNLEEAAGVGRLDVARSFFHPDGSLKANATQEQMVRGFLWACGFSRNDVVAFLLDKGFDLAAHDADGQTGLHWAAMNGELATVRLLLARGAPLEVKNVYGGTVLGQTLWSAAHAADPDAYVAIVEALLAAGAKVLDRHPPINQRMDALLQQHGSVTDDGLSWDGEKPET